jgi:hypothetical protein
MKLVMSDESYFEVASGQTLREKYGLTSENRPVIHLNSANVPEKIRQWIPLAERWGIGDDLIREDCVRKATPEELEKLLSFQNIDGTVLDEWLTGAESHSSKPTEEYLAFTCLSMAYDLARVLAKKHSKIN